MNKGWGKIQAGQRYGILTVVKRMPPDKHRHSAWWVRCDCGAEKQVLGMRLLNGHAKSCGDRKHRFKAIKFAQVPGYSSWIAMKQRCYNEKNYKFKYYGARGIVICDRWQESFQNFLDDMGPRPSPEHSIDRWPDPNGNYEPGNCRWATSREQSLNTRRSVYVEIDGKKILLDEYAALLGLSRGTVYNRLRLGWSLEDAVSRPVKCHKK